MQGIDAELDRFEVIERRHAVIAVGVKLQRDIADIFLDQWNQRPRAIGSQQTGDVFEANPIGFDRRRLARPLGEILVGVTRRDGIDHVDNHFHAEFLQRVNFDGRGIIVVPRIG